MKCPLCKYEHGSCKDQSKNEVEICLDCHIHRRVGALVMRWRAEGKLSPNQWRGILAELGFGPDEAEKP